MNKTEELLGLIVTTSKLLGYDVENTDFLLSPFDGSTYVAKQTITIYGVEHLKNKFGNQKIVIEKEFNKEKQLRSLTIFYPDKYSFHDVIKMGPARVENNQLEILKKTLKLL